MHQGLRVPAGRRSDLQRAEAAGVRDRSNASQVGDAAPLGFVPVRVSSLAPVVRRVVLTKLVTDPGTDSHIWDAVIGGRSPSPFTDTMGAHSTAWVAHLDAIRRHVVNLPASEGALYLVELAEAAADDTKSPLLTLKDTMPEKQKKTMTDAQASMSAEAVQLKLLAEDDHTDVAILIASMRRLIVEYLTFVNYQPTATVRGGDPSGHGEGVARGLLNQFEYVCALTKRAAALKDAGDSTDNELAQDERDKKLVTTALGLVGDTKFGRQLVKAAADKFDATKHPVLRVELVHNLWAMFAAETPGVYAMQTGDAAVKVWTAALKNFLHTVRLAYPYGYDFTSMQVPAHQWEGLQFALAEAKVTLSPGVEQGLQETIMGKAAVGPRGKAVPAMDTEESMIRGLDQYAEVAESDLLGGGAGFTVTVLMHGASVGSVEMTGRTQSPFSKSMGAHTTAWAAVEDGLRARVVGKDLPTAFAALHAVATQSLTDPRLDLSHLVDEKQQHHLAYAYSALQGALSAPAPISDQARISGLENLTKFYLSYSNLLPLSTIESGGVPGGRAEGRARTFLLAFEAKGESEIPGDVDKQIYVAERLVALFDEGGLEMFPPDLGDDREPSTLGTHPLVAQFGATSPAPSPDELRGMAVAEFYATVTLAYPKAVAYIGWELDPMNPELPVVPMDTFIAAPDRKRPRLLGTPERKDLIAKKAKVEPPAKVKAKTAAPPKKALRPIKK